ncbi:hypothetical protein BTVI_146937 [Pitangus sulphuratus]|nr:hypothetical protein BTVI_146937 [Pitangus sulphuratus]
MVCNLLHYSDIHKSKDPDWIHSKDEGKAVDAVYLDFIKAFDTISHRILLEKLAAHSLDVGSVHWVKTWMDDWAQRLVVSGEKTSLAQDLLALVPKVQPWPKFRIKSKSEDSQATGRSGDHSKRALENI